MINSWNRTRQIFGFKGKSVFILLAMSLVAVVSEAFGLGIFYPIFQYIRLEGDASVLTSQSEIWLFIYAFAGYLEIPVTLSLLLIIAFSFFIGRQLFMYMKMIYQAKIHSLLDMNIKNKLFNSYLNASSEFHDSLPVGDLVNVVSTETQSSISGVMTPIELLSSMIMMMVFLVMLLLISWQMTIFSLIVLVLASYIPKVWIKLSEEMGKTIVKYNLIMSEFLVSRLKNPRLVRLSGTELAEKNEFYLISKQQRKNRIRAAILVSKTEVIMEPVVIGISLLFLYYAVTTFNMTIELIGLYLLISMRLLPVVKSIILSIQKVKSTIGPINIILDRLGTMESNIEKNSGKLTPKILNKFIKFENVSFRYPGLETDTLSNLNLVFPANKMTALVGPSGSGKSTIIDLIPRIREPRSGNVYFDDYNLVDIELSKLRELIVFAPQNPQLFGGTVKEHISYGKKNATSKEIIEASKLAGIHNFIESLPNTYDTHIGEDGINLSGGQRQRIDLARVLIKQTSIIILDEPTSHLDAESEVDFIATLDEIRSSKKITIIIISHRLSTVFTSDQIILFQNGKVVQSGSHDELLGSSSWYQSAWSKQNLI